MITKKVQPRYNDKGQLCGTRVEYRIFGLPVFVKTLFCKAICCQAMKSIAQQEIEAYFGQLLDGIRSDQQFFSSSSQSAINKHPSAQSSEL
jgi:hypothetical protein